MTAVKPEIEHVAPSSGGPRAMLLDRFGRRCAIGFALAALVVGAPACLAGGGPPEPREPVSEFDATLLKGKEAVCPAYVKRLNDSPLSRVLKPTNAGLLNTPHCDRGENNYPPGFQLLKRVPLTIAELRRLQPSVFAFLNSPTGTPLSVPAPPKLDPSLPLVGGSDEYRQSTAINARDNYYFYRFEPRIDIDNDGVQDDVVVWKESPGFCGELDNGGNPMVFRTDILVLDKNGALDMEKTRRILGHPMGAVLAFANPSDPTHPHEVSDTQFRPIGMTLGVIVFRGVTYLDTFYAPGGDLENRRDGTPNYLNTLAVLRHKDGKTSLVCEILVR
jgi:hypothetical protein